MRELIIFFLVAAPSAPAPKPKERPPQAVTPGRYVATFNGTPYRITLHEGGDYVCDLPGYSCRGRWRWEAATRTLRVVEGCNDRDWFEWAVPLDADLKGKAVAGPSLFGPRLYCVGSRVELRREP